MRSQNSKVSRKGRPYYLTKIKECMMINSDTFMDQKTPANLDPKLKEAYERVMGMSTATVQPAASPASQPVAQPASQTQPQASSSPFVSQPAPSTFTPTTIVQPTASVVSEGASGVAAGSVHTAGTAAKAASGGSSIMTVVYIIAGIVFILAYTLFWIKILNFQTPFPLPF